MPQLNLPKTLIVVALLSGGAFAVKAQTNGERPESATQQSSTAPGPDAAATSAQPAKKKGLFGKLNDKLNKSKETLEKATGKANKANEQLGGLPAMVINPLPTVIATAQATATKDVSTKAEVDPSQTAPASTDAPAGNIAETPKKKGLFGKLNDKLNKTANKIQDAADKANGKVNGAKPATDQPQPKQ